jgi:hypothetical protein
MSTWKITFCLAASLLIFSSLAGCKDTHPKIYNKSSAFIILDNAKDIFYDLRDGGSIQLSYKIKENYPATSVINHTSSQMKTNGWKLLEKDYLNPDLPSSHERGWSNFEDAVRSPTKIVHQWIGDWQDKYGNIVRYIFIYQYPKDEEENLSILQIHELFMPESLVSLANKEQ